jgi:hypothetical protein
MENTNFQTLADQLLSNLPGYVKKVLTDNSRAVFINPTTKLEFWLINIPEDGQIKAAYIQPLDDMKNGHSGIGERPAIYFSAEKKKILMLNDLKKRFLIPAEKYHAEAMEKVSESNSYYKSKHLTLDTITAALGIPAKDKSDYRSFSFGHSFGGYSIDKFHLDIRVEGPQSITINTRGLSQPQAIKLLHFLKGLSAAN